MTEYISFFDFLSEVITCNEPGSLQMKTLNLLQKKYPKLHEAYVHNMRSRPDISPESPRLGIYGFDDVTTGRMSYDGKYFLTMLDRNWDWITGQTQGTCDYCGKEVDDLSIERQPIASYEFGPAIRFYENLSMDGGASRILRTCRACAITVMKKVMENTNSEKMECVVFGGSNDG